MLEVRGLQAFYGPSHVLQGIDLTVGAGEAVGIVGPNGAGKTTTLRALMGLVPRVEGSLSFAGEDLRRLPSHARARRGLVFAPDQRAVFPHLTVDENLRAGTTATPETAYTLFPTLAARARQLGGTLSGGEQKMLTLARALAMGPRLLLVDEPTEGLMPRNREVVQSALQNAVRDGVSVLLVDSSLELVDGVCGRRHQMARGRLVDA